MAKDRNLLQLLGITARGVAMGAADVVPGVSGGTIAFITGIYEEFIHSIKSVDFAALKVWRKEGFKAFWNHINGSFLVALFLGIGIAIATLASAVTYLLHNHPILLWSFFFGLVIASVIFVGKTIKKWNVGVIVALLVGTGIAFWITILKPSGNAEELWYITMSGSIAICAMILPGISGSFILVLLGSYGTIMAAIDDHNWKILGLFAVGCIIGLIAFSRVLSWLFKKFHDLTLALLTGFLVGSLNKIWPWKEVVDTITFTKKSGEVKTVPIEENILPGADYAGDPQLLYAILLMVAGLAVILVLEKVAGKKP